jgi:hypothetical protein
VTNDLFNLYWDQSEDIYFLEKAGQKGFKIYVDTEHTCEHVGMKGYGVKDFEKYSKDNNQSSLLNEVKNGTKN